MRLRLALSTCAALPLLALSIPARCAPVAAANGPAANVRRFIDQVDIPYQVFTLANGLRVLVHTDHSAPIVNVGVWYDVGSKHEPAGRTGFAHLFEHLMFNGSENVPGDYLKPLMDVGGQVNGSTSADRTNYYETVPTQALERALFMESDRMGHLLGAIGQPTLDEQRGVVQNEKRQGDDAATSIVHYMTLAALYPAGHPYAHTVIGSMKDLDAADLDDVRQWFKAHYGPNNALLILAGDVDPDTARRLVGRYFGDIPAGPRNVRPAAAPVPMAHTVRETVTAPVTNPIIVRTWPVPGTDDHDGLALDAVMGVMGGGDDDVLTERLVRRQKLFQRVGVMNDSKVQAGEFSITGTVRPGVDPRVAAAALDREIARFLHDMPSADTVDRFVARYTYGFVRRLEDVAARGTTLGEGAIFRGKPDAYKEDLHVYASQTPASVMAVARRWLDRPRYEVTVLPGPRVTPKDDAGIDGSTVADAPPAAAAAAVVPIPIPAAATGDRGPLPEVAPPRDSRFPPIEHARLRNGIPVLYARTPLVPFTTVSLGIDGGALLEPADRTGTMEMMYTLLDKGVAGQDEHAIERDKERLGLSLAGGIAADAGSLLLDSPDVNLGAGLAMMRQMLVAPTFPAATIERLKREKLDMLAQLRLDAGTLTNQVMTPLVNAGSPFNRLLMYDDPATLRGIDRAGIVVAHARWVRPERAHVEIVSDKPLIDLMPELERTIGSWTAPGAAQPLPDIPYRPQPGTAQIVLVDLPGAVQASVQGSQFMPIGDSEPGEALDLANAVLGSAFTSRINMNLREDKHWTYGTFAYAIRRPYGSQYLLDGTIQQDKVGPAIAEVMKEVKGILSDRPITEAEFEKVKAAALGGAASAANGRYQILGAISGVRKYHRPDTYPGLASERLRGVSLAAANAALRAQIAPAGWIWCVVGNAAIIRPQLAALGLPVRVVKAADVLPPL